MKIIFFLCCIIFSMNVVAQQQSFPANWEGNWRGQLQWYKTGKEEPQEVTMKLKIQRSNDSTWTWQIIYGDETKDNRPYLLICKDSTKTHWVIDELNGIVLDQYWVAGRLSGAFTVMNSTIINNYWMEDDKLIVEFYNVSAKPVATTGKGTEDSPKVNSYKVGSYQKAILKKQ